MRLRAAPGEIVLAVAFMAVGLFWVFLASRMTLWDGFAPGSGFLPLIFGILLLGLAAAALLLESTSASGAASDDHAAESQPIRTPFIVLLALAAGVAGIEPAGFFAAMFLTMLFLFRIVEKSSLVSSVIASAATSAVLTLVFRTWLGVPLPKGPWGF